MKFACVQRYEDGSYLSYIYPKRSYRRRPDPTRGLPVRVIEYRLQGSGGREPWYRLLTTIVDPQQAPARELAALYQQRWEMENTLDELKVHLRGPRSCFAVKRQTWYGRSFTVSSCFISPYAVSCMKLLGACSEIPTNSRLCMPCVC